MRFGFLGIVALGWVLAAGPATADGWRLEPGAGTDDGLSIRFTPRLSSIMSLDQAKLTLSLGAAGLESEPFAGGGRYEPGRPGETRGFQLGGALHLDDVRLGAGYVQTERGRVESDGFAAGLSYHRFSTGVGFTETVGPSGSTSRYALGAQLDAAPGLSVGADLTVRDGEGEPVDTTGVLRLRLAF